MTSLEASVTEDSERNVLFPFDESPRNDVVAIMTAGFDALVRRWPSRCNTPVMSGPAPNPDDVFRHDDVVGKEQLDVWLDHALEATFPASDPIASPPASPEADEGLG